MPLQTAPYLLYYLHKVRKAERLSPSELDELQNRKLRAVVKFAYENVLYYHKLFDSVNLTPEEIRTKEDLVKIPITDKKTLQELPISERFAKGVNISKCMRCRTSGSSGMPLDVFLNKKEMSYRIAMQTRVYGLNLTNKKVNMLDREPLPPEGSPATIFRILKKYLNHLGLWRRYYFSLSEEPCELVSKLLEVRPDIIETQPSTLKLISEYAKKNNITGISPKLIFTRAELLSREDRKQMESLFNTELTDLYGTTEFGIVAWECEKHQGYHINSDIVVVEAIRDNQQVYGQEGQVICTDLTNYTMPFIRYALGDIVILSKEKCSCGRNFPLIELVEGRTNDFVTLASGKILSPVLLALCLETIDGINQFRLIQEKIDTFNVQIVKGQNFREATIEKIRKKLRELLGGNAQINIDMVGEIPKDKSGKVHPVVSKVPVNL
ncbi:MAG: phenylacetate--CoA ligase family protein [bacterium]